MSTPSPEVLPSGPAGNRPGSPFALFIAFSLLALQGFGGVLAVAQRELVDRRGWLSRAEFVELYSIAQMLPGPNVVNLSLMIGDRYFGWRGALAARSRRSRACWWRRCWWCWRWLRAISSSRSIRRWPARCAAWARWRPG